jgi:hypothetical protein
MSEEKTQAPEVKDPKEEHNAKAIECANKINEVLNQYGFIFTITHEISSNKNSDGRVVLDVDHQIRFVNKK